ncbi:MAG: DUF7344 domain-containing protein [Halolamina sp.]
MSETPITPEDELDELVRVLANPVRRAVLRHFTANPTGSTLEGLAEVAISAEVAIEIEPRDELDALMVALHHVHLPKLEAVGLLTYDPECNRADPEIQGPEAEHVWRAITAMESVVTLVGNDPRTADPTQIDGRLSAN